ncbi:hypothetical protein [Chelatococcus asaccharovorans]|uniref:hypothetical protein n=1 Tax=Chelatococcus asaccharovorans TaxID=28210 RepID=UPI00397679CC
MLKGPARTIDNCYARRAHRGISQRGFTKVATAGSNPEELCLDRTHIKAHQSAAQIEYIARNNWNAQRHEGSLTASTAGVAKTPDQSASGENELQELRVHGGDLAVVLLDSDAQERPLGRHAMDRLDRQRAVLQFFVGRERNAHGGSHLRRGDAGLVSPKRELRHGCHQAASFLVTSPGVSR